MNTSTLSEAAAIGAADERITGARDIAVPLDRLYRSPHNVRKLCAPPSIAQLAAMIRALGLLQRLLVTDDGTGRYAVEGGARRLAALELLAAEGHLAPDAPIDCRLFPSRQAVEVSLAENAGQEKMHPADAYEAFATLIDQGLTPAQIGGMFGVSVQTVARRLALGRLAPRFLDLYRAGEVDAEQLQALTLTDDHAQQGAAWDALPPYQRSAYRLRQVLLREDVRGDSDLARFVGIEAYEAAGGGVRRDLFGEADGCWLTDAPLLSRLARQQLEALAEAERADGWSWVEVHLTVDPETLRSLAPQQPGERALSDAEAAGWTGWMTLLDEARAEFDAAQRACMDAAPGSGEEVTASLCEQRAEAVVEALEDAVAVLRMDRQVWTAVHKATCGVIVSVGREGAANVRRGLRRRDDNPAAPGVEQPSAKAGRGPAAAPARLRGRRHGRPTRSA